MIQLLAFLYVDMVDSFQIQDCTSRHVAVASAVYFLLHDTRLLSISAFRRKEPRCTSYGALDRSLALGKIQEVIDTETKAGNQVAKKVLLLQSIVLDRRLGVRMSTGRMEGR